MRAPEPITALLIEDNPGDARLIRELLAEPDGGRFRVEHADSLANGLDRLAIGGIDAVLLDLMLPDSTGLATLASVQRQAPSVPILVLTGLDDEELAIDAMREGAQDYLPKSRANSALLARSLRYAVERKRAEVERKRLLAELEATLEAAQAGVITYDPAGKIIRMNRAAEQMMQSGPAERAGLLDEPVELPRLEDAAGKPIPPEESPAARALRGETVRGYLLRMHSADRSYWLLASAAPLATTEDRPLGAVVTLSDVTRLQELQEQQDEMASLISHDLRNPLTALHGHAQILERSLAKRGLRQEGRAAAAILRNAERMNSMIHDLVESTRLTSGSLDLKKEPTNLGVLIVDICDHVGNPEDWSRLETECQEHLPPVMVDRERFERVLVNLIANACKYSSPEDLVTVRLVVSGQEAVLSVVDRGVGIPAEELPYVFTKFFRASTGRQADGLGLGLYIARLIVEAHGGQIGVESEVGQGSTFTIRLPLPANATASVMSSE